MSSMMWDQVLDTRFFIHYKLNFINFVINHVNLGWKTQVYRLEKKPYLEARIDRVCRDQHRCQLGLRKRLLTMSSSSGWNQKQDASMEVRWLRWWYDVKNEIRKDTSLWGGVWYLVMFKWGRSNLLCSSDNSTSRTHFLNSNV